MERADSDHSRPGRPPATLAPLHSSLIERGRIVVVGLGGIGSFLVRLLLRFVAVRGVKTLPHSGPDAPFRPVLQLGDHDASGNLAINDAIGILNFLFRGGSPPHIVDRPLQPESIPAGRFTNNGNGTVSDTPTSLMWHRMPIEHGQNEGTVDWFTALQRAEDNNLFQADDWRLPNIFELATLSNYAANSTATPAMAPEFVAFSNDDCASPIPPIGCNLPYWSSTTSPLSSVACHFLPNTAVDPNVVAAGSVRTRGLRR